MQSLAALEKKVAVLKAKSEKDKQIAEHKAAIKKLSSGRSKRKVAKK